MLKIPTIPKIEIKSWNIKEETTLFMNFLNHKEFPANRNFILEAFPILDKKIKDSSNEQESVYNFLKNFEQKNHSVINTITINDSIILAKQSKLALETLRDVMDYKWSKSLIYYATPTILPFSPFKDNHFYFSILGTTNGKKSHNVLMVAIHEISHFIFFDLLKEIERKNKLHLIKASQYFLKEALTTTLLNESPLKNILKIKKYKGNPEIHYLYVEWMNKKPILFVDAIGELYRESCQQKIPFKTFLTKIIINIHQHQDLFSKKRDFWNIYGKQILNKPHLRKQYSEPIIMKRERHG